MKNVFFLGSNESLNELEKINKKLGLKTFVITSPDQSKKIDYKKEIKIFDRLDSSFTQYISNKVKVEETLFVSLASRWIFKKETIKNIFKFNLVNFHGSRLPLDAGGGGFSWRILREDRIDNQLVQVVDEGIDTGPILFSEKSIFPSYCKIPADYEKFSSMKLLSFYEKFISLLSKGNKFNLHHQPDYLGRYNPRLESKTNGWIDWNLNSHQLLRFINAFDDPYSGASTMINNYERVYLKKVQLHGGESTNHPFMSGIISRHDSKWIVVSTQDEDMMLIIEKVLDDKGQNIISHLKPGDRFFTPAEKLDLAKSFRPKYGPKGIKNKI